MAIVLSPEELVNGARAGGGVAIPSLPPARLMRSYVNDEARLEIRDFPSARLGWLKSLGCFTEIISFKTRLFVPTNRALDILGRLECEASGSADYGQRPSSSSEDDPSIGEREG